MSATLANSSSTPRLPGIVLFAKLGIVLRTLAVLVAVVLLTTVVAITGRELDDAATRAQRVSGPIYLPRAEYLRPMSLGWQNVLADVLWFHTISYFGEHFRSDRTYPWLAQMCDLITELDPRAEHVYRFAGFILPWEADQVDAGIALLEKGTRQLPDSWLLAYYAGFSYYFFKDDYVHAIAHLRRAIGLPGVHPTVAAMAALLSAEQYGPETTVAFLTELEGSVESDDLRHIVQQKLQEAQAAATLQRLNTALDTFHARFGYYPIVVEALTQQGLVDASAAPSGEVYVVDPVAAQVRAASGFAPARLHQSRIRQKVVRGESVRDL